MEQVMVELREGYKPSGEEPYMNPLQLEYFRRKLLAWRETLGRELNELIDELRHDHLGAPGDLADRAFLDIEARIGLSTEDRVRDLIYAIDGALDRIEDGSYGFCEDTGDEIGLKRLEAWPVATLSLAAKRKREQLEKLQKA
jgi:DnaK suppressor protein